MRAAELDNAAARIGGAAQAALTPPRSRTSHRALRSVGKRSWMNLPVRRRLPDRRLALAGGGGGAAAGRDGLRARVAPAGRAGRALAAAAEPAGARWQLAGVGRRASRGTRLSAAGRSPPVGRSGHRGHDRLAPAGGAAAGRLDHLDGRAAPGRSGPRDCPRPQPRLSGPAGRPAWAGAALLPSAAALADGSSALGAGIGGRRRGGERLRRAAAVSDDDRRTRPASAGAAALVACPRISSHANHFFEENCHAQGLETPFRPALAA